MKGRGGTSAPPVGVVPGLRESEEFAGGFIEAFAPPRLGFIPPADIVGETPGTVETPGTLETVGIAETPGTLEMLETLETPGTPGTLEALETLEMPTRIGVLGLGATPCVCCAGDRRSEEAPAAVESMPAVWGLKKEMI